ncbi:MAG: energy transducer TonB, partial [Candidatus Acidiferrum sp.]
AVVNEKGRVISAVTTYGDPYGIFQGTEKDVREWRFNPATKDGKPVSVCMRLQVNFRSRH